MAGRADEKRLRSRLIEDVDSPEEVERLLPAARRLNAWRAPAPTAQETARLIETLRPALPVPGRRTSSRVLRAALLLLCAQLRVVRREIWAASMLVMALGGVVAYSPGSASSILPLILTAPLVAAVGVAFIYGPFVDPALEIELTAPVSPRLILLARLVLVFGFDLALGLIASVALAGLSPGISFWPLVMAWLAPMAFLSALAFLLTVLTADPLLGTLVSMGLWIAQAIRQLPAVGRVLWYVPNLMTGEAYPWLWLFAALLVGLAFWLGGQEERWIGHQA